MTLQTPSLQRALRGGCTFPPDESGGLTPTSKVDLPYDEAAYKNRIELTNEIHKHRNVPLRAPLAASVLAFIKDSSVARDLIEAKGASPAHGGSIIGETLFADGDPQGANRSPWSHLSALCELYSVSPPPSSSSQHFSTNLGPLRLVFEDHKEFCTFSFFRMSSPGGDDDVFRGGPSEDAFSTPPISEVPAQWISAMPGRVILAMNVVIEQVVPEQDTASATGGRDQQDDGMGVNMQRQQRLSKIFNFRNVMACNMQVGLMEMRMFTDYRIQSDGFTRMLCQTNSTTEALNSTSGRWQLGRMVKHIVDMECYRLLALLALPLAQRTQKPIELMEAKLQALIVELNASGRSSGAAHDHSDDHRVLAEIIALHAKAEQVSADIKPRFAAAEAYFQIVKDRIEQLSMGDFGRYTCCDKFIMQRLSPAMQTLRSTEARLELNMASLQRATNLLRTKVEVTQEQQNAQVLKSMARRAEMQVKLQETVEGLSAGPVTYYTLGVLGYGLKGLHSAGALPCSVEVALGAAMPVVLVAVYLSLRRLHKHLHGSVEQH